jgi:hypothetical protein
MNKIENASCVVYDDDAPEFMVHIMYALLNDKNKEKVIDFVERLREEQRTLQPSLDSLC